MESVRHHYNTTPVTPCSAEHFLKCILTVLLRLNSLSHRPQENCLYSECTGRWRLNASAVQKHFGHSRQTYSYMSLNVYFEELFATEFLLTNVTRDIPSVLWHCWLGDRKGIRPVKNWVVRCWHGYLSGARCRLAYGPADATATHYLMLQ